jgi:hypothetical protein
MLDKLSNFLDWLSEYLAARKGLLPLIGILLVLINLIINLFPATSFFTESDILLNIGVIVAVLGLMLARAL